MCFGRYQLCICTIFLLMSCRRITEPQAEATVSAGDVVVKWSGPLPLTDHLKSGCRTDEAMVIQYYQDGNCMSGADCGGLSKPKANGSVIKIENPGRTEIKIWNCSDGPRDSIWVNVVAR
jgi:hypothetical protein